MEIKKVLSPFSRILSMILSILIIFYMIPITVVAKETAGDSVSANEATQNAASVVDKAESEELGAYEVVDLREENVKHFRLSDGRYIAAQYDYPVHYLNENGDFEDINNTLSSSGSEFSTGDARIKFIKKITGNGNIFTLHENNTKMTIGLVGAEKKTSGEVTSKLNSDFYIEDILGKMINLENISSAIRYPNIIDGVDIEYVIHSLNVKENIIIKEKKDTYAYTFTIELNNLYAELSGDGNVYVYNKDDVLKYVIPAPIVYDASGEYAPEDASGYELETVGNGKYELTVSVSPEWMNDSQRAFPITIDPPIESVSSVATDLYIDESSPDSINNSGDSLEVSKTKISYLKFNEGDFTTIPHGAYVTHAELYIIGSKFGNESAIVGVYPVVTSWDDTLTYNKKEYSNQGAISGYAMDYEVISYSGTRYSFDITELYRSWVEGAANYGVALKLVDDESEACAYFTSYEYYPGEDDGNFYEPTLLVAYVYNDGLESYFPTSAHSAGTGGEGCVNLATGRLTLVIPTLTATDSLFGFTPTLVYNSSLAGKPLTNANVISPFSASYLPYGFKLNLQEFIQKKSYVNGDDETQNYYALYDADGTTHTLYYMDGAIRDDSGLGLKLTFSGSNIVITDKSHTKKTYTSYDSSNWYLTSVTDSFGNKLIFDFDSSYRPISVKIQPVGMDDIIMLSFVYSGNMLSAVYNSTSSDFVRLKYSGNYLSDIEYGKGNPASSGAAVYASASYAYDDFGHICEITDNTTNKTVEYGIYGGKITAISEWAGNTLGQKMSFSYQKGCTFVNFSGNDEILDTDDDTTTQYVLDKLGRAVAINSYDIFGETIYHSSIGVYGEFQAVAKNSLVETANIPTIGTYIEDFDSYTTTLNGYVGQEGTYTHVFYDKTRESDEDISYTESNRFRISGLGYSNSVIKNEYADFSIKVRITYTHGVETLFSFSFADAENVWQMVSGNIDCNVDDGTSTSRIISKIEIICSYNGQLKSSGGEAPYAHFDKIAIVESSDIDTTKHAYDINGNIAVKTIDTYNTEYYEYDTNGNLARIANNRGEIYDYYYDENHVLVREEYYTFSVMSDALVITYNYPYVATLLEKSYETEEYSAARALIDGSIVKTLVCSTDYEYDEYGLLESVTYAKGTTTDTGRIITSSYRYVIDDTEYENYLNIFGALLTETDSRGYVTKYFYDDTNGNLLAEIDVSSGSGYVYSYDEIGRLEKVTPASGSATSYSSVANAEEVEYTYDEALRLSKINTATTEYTFTYDAFGNSTSVSAGNNTLATYEYYPNNGKLKKINYGNGYSEEYSYNDIEKISEVWYNYSNGTRIKAYSYEYNGSQALTKFTNHQNGEVVTYTYDNLGRFISSTETKSSNSAYKNNYSVEYDDYGRVCSSTNVIDYLASSTSYSLTLGYDYLYNTNGTLDAEQFYLPQGGSIETEYTYDEFLRPVSVSSSSGSFSHSVEYIYYYSDSKTTNLINGYVSTVNGAQSGFTYAYDSKGNITVIVDPNNDGTTYTYDDLGQLVKEVKGNTTKTYTYDNAGNIKSIVTTTETESQNPDPGFKPIIKALDLPLPSVITSTQTLGYTNSQWGDLLTSYNGTAITYDEIGNPLSYYNGSSYTFTWEGRRLVGATKGSNTMSFEYNDDGIRTSKTVNGVETIYYVNGGQIVAEKTGTRTIVYIYDASGAPIGMMYRTTSYAEGAFDVFWFEKNLQGDIIAIYNASGTKVATYTYTDAWGNHTVSYSNGGASTGAAYNPFRYRGYYYDTDLGMYYLQSRYYDAKICRFISPDHVSIINTTPTALTDKNLFAYCDNNPVSRLDKSGYFWTGIVIGAIVGATAGIVGQFISDMVISALNGELTISNWQTYTGAAVGGACGGIVLAVTGDMNIANFVIGAITTGVGQSLEKLTISEYNKSWAEIGANALIDGAISFGLGKLPGIKGATAGRNSWSAVYKSGLTKLRNGTVARMSAKVFAKGIGASVVGGFALDGYYGIKQYAYDKVKGLLNN